MVAVIILAAAGVSFFFFKKHWLNNRYRRAALRELNTLGTGNDSKEELLEEVSILLRRVAVQAYGRSEVAPLSGDRWLAFLDRTGKTDRFSLGEARVLGTGLYQSSVEADMDRVIGIAKHWVKEHRR